MNAPVAAVFYGSDRPLAIERFSWPELAFGEALAEVDCCTLCGSDLHTIHGRRSVETPMILGHEVVGRIVQAEGPLADVSGAALEVGDRVSWSIAASCRSCFYCDDDIPQKCERLFKYGHRQVEPRHPLSGGLATHCHLAAGTPLVRWSQEVPDTVAALANCATATVAAALRTAGDFTDQTVVIHGAGMLGLTAAAMAREGGARHVAVLDILPERAERAVQFGASPEGAAALEDWTEGRGADVVLDMSGAPEAMENAVQQLRIGGRLILVGAVFPDRPLALAAEQLVRKMLRVEGVHNYAPCDLAAAAEFLERSRQRYPFASLVEREYPLEEINQAVAEAGQMVRAAVRPR